MGKEKPKKSEKQSKKDKKPRKPQLKRSYMAGRATERVMNMARWLGLVLVLLFVPVLCCLCASESCLVMWRRAFFVAKRCALWVQQLCGCSKVQTTMYPVGKDQDHMV